MSNQMEFLMQLYMMNLLQQQQQQQQQQQHQHQSNYTKQEDIISSTATTLPQFSTVDAIQQQQQEQQRTQIRKNSQNNQNHNNNRSSSRSCSPNSNLLSPFNYNNNNSTNSLPQMLLNTLPPLTQYMLQQQQQQQQQLLAAAAAPSNLLLTPTTPNSQKQQQQEQQFNAMATDFIVGDTIIPTTTTTTTDIKATTTTTPIKQQQQQSFATNNFLQSSTVTSTPTECSPSTPHIDDASATSANVAVENVASVNSISNDTNVDDLSTIAGDTDGTQESTAQEKYTVKQECVYVDDADFDEEDEKPLSSLHSSSGSGSGSGGASTSSSTATSTSTASSEKLLTSGAVHTLESTTDSYDSPSMYTPIKQPADSSFHNNALSKSNSSSATALLQETTNVTPKNTANTMLTPPSSDQAKCPVATAAAAGTAAASTVVSLTTASSLDAFLQNEENLKNLKKVSSYLECENVLCRQETLREHFHCYDEPCQGKILSKKDDIIRHLKWHKKRKESLQLGFARFSSADDCAPAYGAGCAYNWKQTHYHCIYEHCPKVYVSTSDVQMHANFHRKDSEIVQEGFRRFRAHENCRIEDCPFYGKKISHYHCCREGCNHTFKNKADMDKHKTYHLKDYQLTQDGFKKILKTEVCPFEGCKFSTVSNHIHCVREDCNYILHSSSQMISHKRKHDRSDGEQAYQQYKLKKDVSSEDESPNSMPKTQSMAVNASTPLSSLSAEQFLARKRGRPPKKIQLPATIVDAKRPKLETDTSDSLAANTSSNTSQSNATAMAGLFPSFLSNFNPAAAAAAQSMQGVQDPNAPNFQLTHLMALFQLQNPLFYQNLYPGGAAGAAAANMANILAASSMPQNASMFGNLAAFNAASAAAAAAAGAAAGAQVKSEFNNKQDFKE